MRTALAAVATAVALTVAAPTAGPAAAATDPDGPLRVATELPAPRFWNGAGAADGGFEADRAQALAARLGRPGVVVVPVPFARIVRGRFAADLALAQVTITPARARVVDFGVPYLTVDQGVLVRRDGPVPQRREGLGRVRVGPDPLGADDRPDGGRPGGGARPPPPRAPGPPGGG
ncbi:MAG: transporter substrate-binding domain-containing protein, partial [Actinomycetota bacterium]